MNARWLGFPLAAILPFIFVASRWGPSASNPDLQQGNELYRSYDNEFKLLLPQANQLIGKELLKYESVTPDLLPKKVIVAGSHYEFGYLVGTMARNYGMQMHRRTAANAEMNLGIVEMYQSICPQYLEKVRGIARAYNMTLDDLDFIYLENSYEAEFWWRLFKYQQFSDSMGFSGPNPAPGCSLASYYLEGEGRQLIGRNFDYGSDLPHFLLVSSLDGAHKTIGHSMFQLHQWMMDGVNERGLFMGLASLGSPPAYAGYADTSAYPDRPAIQSHHLVRIVLDTCATVDEAVALIGKIRVWFPSGFIHFLIADAQGKSVVVSFDRDKTPRVFPRQSSYRILTNTALQEGEEYVYGACWRYRTATDKLQRGMSSLPDLVGVMESVRQLSGNHRTLWTALADLTKRELLAAYRAENYAIPHAFSFSDIKLTWPQLALGGGYECTILLSNKRASDWSGHFNLVSGNHESWAGSWSLDGSDRTGLSTFAVSIPPQSTVKLRLSGDSASRSGYLEMFADGSCSVNDVATSYFYSFLEHGQLKFSTGSAAAPSGRLFGFPVEKTFTVNTGIAWAPDSVTSPFAIVVTLFDNIGAQVQQKTLIYSGHEAKFFDQVFDNIPSEFLGRVRIESQENIHLEVLRLEQTGSSFGLTNTAPDRML
jgi:predicted choloylglycine hydrolase